MSSVRNVGSPRGIDPGRRVGEGAPSGAPKDDEFSGALNAASVPPAPDRAGGQSEETGTGSGSLDAPPPDKNPKAGSRDATLPDLASLTSLPPGNPDAASPSGHDAAIKTPGRRGKDRVSEDRSAPSPDAQAAIPALQSMATSPAIAFPPADRAGINSRFERTRTGIDADGSRAAAIDAVSIGASDIKGGAAAPGGGPAGAADRSGQGQDAAAAAQDRGGAQIAGSMNADPTADQTVGMAAQPTFASLAALSGGGADGAAPITATAPQARDRSGEAGARASASGAAPNAILTGAAVGQVGDVALPLVSQGAGAASPMADASRTPRRTITAASPAEPAAFDLPAGSGAVPGSTPSASIAVADAALTPGHPGFADGVSRQVIAMAAAGRQEAVVRLHPPQLGDLTVRVAVQGRDVSAWFASAQPQVQQAVSQAIGQLRLDLGGAGFNLANAWVGGEAFPSKDRAPTGFAPPRPQGGAAGIAGAASGGDGSTRAISGISIYV